MQLRVHVVECRRFGVLASNVLVDKLTRLAGGWRLLDRQILLRVELGLRAFFLAPLGEVRQEGEPPALLFLPASDTTRSLLADADREGSPRAPRIQRCSRMFITARHGVVHANRRIFLGLLARLLLLAVLSPEDRATAAKELAADLAHRIGSLVALNFRGSLGRTDATRSRCLSFAIIKPRKLNELGRDAAEAGPGMI